MLCGRLKLERLSRVGLRNASALRFLTLSERKALGVPVGVVGAACGSRYLEATEAEGSLEKLRER